MNKTKQKSHAIEKLEMNEWQQHSAAHNRRNRRKYTIFFSFKKNGQFQKKVFTLGLTVAGIVVADVVVVVFILCCKLYDYKW